MHRNLTIGPIALSVLLIGQFARADLVLSVTQDPSSTENLNALSPGDQVTFDVTLSGLDVADNQQLGFLGATLTFDPTLLGTPLSITPGPIVADPSGFLMAPDQGVADGSYLFLFADSLEPIVSNGVFFEFTVAVQTVYGSGNIAFSFVSALDTNLDTVAITAGPALPFEVSPTSPIPEPSSWLLLAMAGVTFTNPRTRLRLLRTRKDLGL